MDIDTRSLELLEAIAADGTLTAAARRLHVSQPALSQRLSGLESRIGLRLFDREGRRLVPTQAGRRLLHASSAMLAELRAATRDLGDLRHGRGGVVRLASQCSTNYQWLPPVVHAYGERCPGAEVRIESVPHDEPVAALLADRIDIGLVAKADRRAESLEVHHLFDDAMVAVVPEGHPWAKRPHVDGPDFEGVSLIVFDSYDPARVPALPLPIPLGGTPAKVITTPVLTELALEMVVAGQGVAILPEWVVTPYLAARRLVVVPLTARPVVRAWSCVTRREPPAHVAAFAELIRAHFADASAA